MTPSLSIPRAARVLVCTAAVFAAVAFRPSSANACETCPEIKNLDESLAEASAVVVAELPNGVMPDYASLDLPRITLEVTRVLRGDLPLGPIQVHAYSGMCAYGFTPRQAGPHLLVMTKGSEGEWTPVGGGCSTHELPIVDGKLPADQASADFEDFVAANFPDAAAPTPPKAAPAPGPDHVAPPGPAPTETTRDPKPSPGSNRGCAIGGVTQPAGGALALGLWFGAGLLRRRRRP